MLFRLCVVGVLSIFVCFGSNTCWGVQKQNTADKPAASKTAEYLQALFRKYDKNENGFIDADEAKTMRRAPDLAYDEDGDQRFDKKELLNALMHAKTKKKPTPEPRNTIKEAQARLIATYKKNLYEHLVDSYLKQFDKNNDGSLDPEELKEIKDSPDQADQDQDGNVTRKELLAEYWPFVVMQMFSENAVHSKDLSKLMMANIVGGKIGVNSGKSLAGGMLSGSGGAGALLGSGSGDLLSGFAGDVTFERRKRIRQKGGGAAPAGMASNLMGGIKTTQAKASNKRAFDRGTIVVDILELDPDSNVSDFERLAEKLNTEEDDYRAIVDQARNHDNVISVDTFHAQFVSGETNELVSRDVEEQDYLSSNQGRRASSSRGQSMAKDSVRLEVLPVIDGDEIKVSLSLSKSKWLPPQMSLFSNSDMGIAGKVRIEQDPEAGVIVVRGSQPDVDVVKNFIAKTAEGRGNVVKTLDVNSVVAVRSGAGQALLYWEPDRKWMVVIRAQIN